MNTDEWLRWQGCERKRYRWESRSLAVNWATLLGWKKGCRFEVYRCGWCGGWHLTRTKGEAA